MESTTEAKRIAAAAELQAAIAACEFFTKRLTGTPGTVRKTTDRLVCLVGRLTAEFFADIESRSGAE